MKTLLKDLEADDIKCEYMLRDGKASDAIIKIEDLRGDGDHYSATIISKTFLDKSKIEQHKMVYDSLKGKMGKELHALMLKTRSE